MAESRGSAASEEGVAAVAACRLQRDDVCTEKAEELGVGCKETMCVLKRLPQGKAPFGTVPLDR
jgi:hypothetical protein